jgi:mannose-1-phosphate guanylyltransferase
VHIGKTHDANEPVAFIHADHYIRDNAGFMHSFRVANKMAVDHGKIVLIGVEPDHPATGFGYIQKDGILDEELFVYNVDSFKEKPDFETAKTYLKSGQYLWNCGYFVGSVNTFKNKMEAYAPELLQNYNQLSEASDEQYEDAYLALTNDAIDYALIEKVKDLLVVPAGFDWIDLGSFADISKVVNGSENGNYTKGYVETEEVNNSYIENQEDKPVAVIGLDNCVVINTPHGILVARKDLSQKVGDISKRINSK